MTFEQEYRYFKTVADEVLEKEAAKLTSYSPKLVEAVRYSLLSHGKRLRPVLFLATCAWAGGDITESAKALCFAIEALHTYTLIHDDLPCMDNDDERRGKPSCHIKFGEGCALLAGDALLNLSAEYALRAAANGPDYLAAASLLFGLTGLNGTIGGQALECDGGDNLRVMEGKTAALFRAAIAGGAMCGGADKERVSVMDKCAHNFGMFFQLRDDFLDNEKKPPKAILDEYTQKTLKLAEESDFGFMTGLVNSLMI